MQHLGIILFAIGWAVLLGVGVMLGGRMGLPWWRSAFSESDATGSYSRLAGFAALLFSMSIVGFCVVTAKVQPFTLEQWAIFNGSPYAINKAVGMIQAARGKWDVVPGPATAPLTQSASA